MDLDSIAAELYAGSREEFTGRRNELAAQARKAGDRDLAARIKELRKPTSAAWLTNRLVTETGRNRCGQRPALGAGRGVRR